MVVERGESWWWEDMIRPRREMMRAGSGLREMGWLLPGGVVVVVEEEEWSEADPSSFRALTRCGIEVLLL